MTVARERLHQLVDVLADEDIGTASRVLEALARLDPSEPYYESATAPLDDEPESEAERAAVAEALAEVAGGDGKPIPGEVVFKKFGLP